MSEVTRGFAYFTGGAIVFACLLLGFCYVMSKVKAPRKAKMTVHSWPSASPPLDLLGPFSSQMQSCSIQPLFQGGAQTVNSLEERDNLNEIVEHNPDGSWLSDGTIKSYVGKLHFSLQFNTIRKVLTVTLIRAQDLPEVEPYGLENSYYIKTMTIPCHHRSFTSSVHRGTRNPELNEHYEFCIPYEFLMIQTLKFSVRCFDRFSHHSTVGELLVHLKELEDQGLNLASTVTLCKQLYQVQQATGEHGEILFSLNFQSLAERITFVLMKAKNLLTVENDNLPDPYVEVFLIHGGRRIKRKKTSTRPRSNQPTFNEALSFDVSAAILHQISFLICVIHDAGKGDENLVLGQVLLGPESSGNEFQHWNEMRVIKKPVARWHLLSE